MPREAFSVHVLEGMPSVEAGSDLAELILGAMGRSGSRLRDGDILAVCHKIVSKSEGRLIRLSGVVPGPQARTLATTTGKAPELCEVILSESREVLRQRKDLVITRNRLGHVVANAAVDQSNTGLEDAALLLPEDPDASAQNLRAALEQRSGCVIGVIITDSFGRAWRIGTLGVAIGQSGPPAWLDQRGERDLYGRELRSTMPAVADALAAAAVLVMGEANEGTPVALIRGYSWVPGDARAADTIRPEREDLFT
ncbi:Coenzyme F420:L-glutamate ligase [Hyphomicrobiales bacterium]|nr:Coenzyme F420:L-glutamate ligase [Hyphomicrobiales bacterium]CAH1692049.1 Coenzyme F420:L-glutamate ligase [Hyphomicrobiales bacterium]